MDSGVFVALCVSSLLQTCNHVLSCTEYFVSEQEAYNATQAVSHDGCLRMGLVGRRNWDAKRKRRVQKGGGG